MVLEKRLERLDKDRKKVKNPELDREAELLEKCKATLEQDLPLRRLELSGDEEKRIQLAQSGKRAGWDDPDMDIYDNYDENRTRLCP